MLKSTRSNSSVTASYAILKGLAEDGGLFVFDHVNNTFYNNTFTTLTYPETAFFVMKEFLDNYSDDQIKEVVANSYNKRNFSPDIVTLNTFENNTYLNLFNGNTFAFKDLALSTLPNLYKTAKKIENVTKKTVILTATSGDTGSAALSGFHLLEDVYVIVLYPANGVSKFQELQMNSFVSDRHFVLPIEGNFDDCQKVVKNLFTTVTPLNVNLSSANSINIGRIIPQIIYYVHSYSELVRTGIIKFGELIDVTVPTGNFGNIYAAYIAKNLGVPISNLVVASNNNNVLTDLFNKQIYDTNQELHKTISPSMDILVSSNLERYLYHLYEGDFEKVNKDMMTLMTDKTITIDILKNQRDFYAYYATEAETKDTIKKVYLKNQLVIDPHTAVARCCVDKYQAEVHSTNHMLIASTASPFKFTSSVLEVFDIEETGNLEKDFSTLATLAGIEVDSRIFEVFNTKVDTSTIQKEDAYETIRKIIGDIDVNN